MNGTILTDNKEIETLGLPSWWSDDFPCVATLIKTGFKGHRQLFAADVDAPPASASRPTKSNGPAKTGLPPMDPLRQSFHSTTSKALNR